MLFQQLSSVLKTTVLCLFLVACGGNNPATNSAPTFTSAMSISVAENTSGVIYTASATDADGDAINYSLSAEADENLFSLDNQTGDLQFLSTPDFENPIDNDANNVYDVGLNATDVNGVTSNSLLSITVTDLADTPVNSAPQFSSANTV